MTNLIKDVSDTSIWVATYRAMESQRPDALFSDPFAEKLVGEKGFEITKAVKAGYAVHWSVIIRTLIIDNFISKAVHNGVDTILNLGAGLDTRPYRLKLPSDLKWIEVDYGHIIDLKNEKLENDRPHCKLTRVKMDLSQTDERAALFKEVNQSSKKVMVLTEGVIPYLDVNEVSLLAKDLRAQSQFTFWVVDYLDPYLFKRIQHMRKTDLKNAPFKFNPENWDEFYQKKGWSVYEMQYLSDMGFKVGRPYLLPWYQRLMIRFASKERIARFQKMSGYAILSAT